MMVILLEYQIDWIKIVAFLLMAIFGASLSFYYTIIQIFLLLKQYIESQAKIVTNI